MRAQCSAQCKDSPNVLLWQNHHPRVLILVESGEHEQEFKVKWSRTKKIYTELVKE